MSMCRVFFCGVVWKILKEMGIPDHLTCLLRNLKEISPEYSLEGLMLKLQQFGHLMQKTDSFEKTLILGKTEGGGRMRVQERMRWLDGITNTMDTSLSRLWELVTGKPGVLQSMGLQEESDTIELLN